MAYNQQKQQQYDAHLATNPNASPPDCLSILYPDFPSYATWNTSAKMWKQRQNPAATVGRMYWVPPSAGERYYLRLLLQHVPGATSFEDLRTTNRNTPNAVLHPSFKEAAIAMGLLEDDAEWERCLTEASSVATGRQLRELFASILAFNDVTDPKELWNKFKSQLAEDFLHQAQQV
jgi:hypothetical protein